MPPTPLSSTSSTPTATTPPTLASSTKPALPATTSPEHCLRQTSIATSSRPQNSSARPATRSRPINATPSSSPASPPSANTRRCASPPSKKNPPATSCEVVTTSAATSSRRSTGPRSSCCAGDTSSPGRPPGAVPIREVRAGGLDGAGPGTLAAFDDAYETVHTLEQRRKKLDRLITEAATTSTFAPTVARLSCLRGISTLSAYALAVEIGDWTRFTPRSIGAYLGLTP